MAFTERYVTQASNGGTGTEGDPWTLTESMANAVAGDRVNIKSDAGYTLAALTAVGGSAASLVVYRGYNSAIGDLETLGRNAIGTLNTTGFPVIDVSGNKITTSNWTVFQNLVITSSIASNVIGGTGADSWSLVSCKVTNTNSSAQAMTARYDDNGSAIQCDFECTGADHEAVLDADEQMSVVDCRFKAVGNAPLCRLEHGVIAHSVMIGNNTGIGVYVNNSGKQITLLHVTCYNLATAFQFHTVLSTRLPVMIGCHATDCVKYIESLYAATANIVVIEMNQRTRDNTNSPPRVGVGDGINVGEITTDTGGIETDYVNAGSDDLHLISGAPGRAAGLTENLDCGGNQHADPAGGGGGLKLVGHGGLVG